MESGYAEQEGIYRNSQQLHIPMYTHQSFPAFLFKGEVGNECNNTVPLLIDALTGFTITCSEFRLLVTSTGSGLSSILEIAPGDVVLILLGNTVYFPIIFNAVLTIGGVVTTANPANTQLEIQRQIEDSSAKFIITMPEYVTKIPSSWVSPIVLLGKPSPSVNFACIPFERVLHSNPEEIPKVRIRMGDPAAILYSSGTTGPSKGVILSHGNLIAAVSAVQIKDPSPEEHAVAFIILPMFHVAGLVWLGCCMLRSAATLVVLGKFDFIHMLEAIQRYKITNLPLVPPLVLAFMKNPLVSRYNLSSLRRAASGAAPLQRETIEAFLAKYPQIQEFGQGYGMTETTGLGASGVAPFGSAGKLTASLEAMVMDIDSGRPLPPNERGELWLRGPSIMQGYLNNPKATAETIDEEGWLRTGDLVYFDNDGYLYVVDRLKELIKYKGFQVAPAELEALLITHPNISDVAVIPFPDEDAGEVPFAFVVPTPGKLITDADVMEFVSRQVAPHKRIRRVAFLEAIPKSAAGKILRKDLIRFSQPASKL